MNKVFRISIVYLLMLFLLAAFVFAKATVIQGNASAQISNSEKELHQQFREFLIKDRNNIPVQEAMNYYDLIGIDAMLDIADEDPNCHNFAHNIGKAVFLKTNDLATALHECGNRCTEGCFHGVLMGAFAVEDHEHENDDPHEHVTSEQLKESILEICHTELLTNFTGVTHCYHGIGHVAMNLANYDLDLGIEYCKLFDTEVAEYYCATGAYMEYMITERSFVNRSDLYPCTVHKDFPAACYRYRLDHAPFKRNPDVRLELANKCLQLSDPMAQAGCFHGYGFAYFSDLRFGAEHILRICSHGSELDKRMCIEGAVGKFQGFNRAIAREACGLIEDSEVQEICLKARNEGIDKDMSLYHYEPRNLFTLVADFVSRFF